MQNQLAHIKKMAVVFVITLSTVTSFCQQGTGIISGMYHTQIFTGESRFEKGYGINYQFFATDNIALEYNFSYVNVPNQINYFKIHGGGLLSARIAALGANSITFNEEGLIMLALFTLLVPEGISYHIDVADDITLSPYANLLSFDYSDGYLHYNNSFGLRMNMTVLNHLNIAPFAFTQLQYRSKAWGGTRTGFGMGAMLGWKF